MRVRRENLENERKEKQRKEQQRTLELQSLAKKVEQIGGLWLSAEAIDEELEKLTTGRRGAKQMKMNAIKSQILFRKKCLKQNIPAKLGNFSTAGKPFTYNELVEKLKAIVALI